MEYRTRMTLFRFFVTLMASVSFIAVRAGEPWLWPIAGVEAGDGIACKPQSYIGSQLNSFELFITAPFGAEVVAPADGVIESVSMGYRISLFKGRVVSEDFDKGFDESVKDFVESAGSDCDPVYVMHGISVRLNDGRTLYITGIRLSRAFMTGESVKQDDILGTLVYSYKDIGKPSLSISVMSPDGDPADPMSPFGIESSFVAPVKQKPVTELTADGAREDIRILAETFADCYPSLDEITTREALDAWCQRETENITGTVEIKDFMKVMTCARAMLHDSHVGFRREGAPPQHEYWDIGIGRIGDGIMVYDASKGFERFLGRKVTAVDGLPVDSLLRHTSRFVPGYDGCAEDFVKFIQLINFSHIYADHFPDAAADRSFVVTFDDGDTLKVNSHLCRDDGGNTSFMEGDFMSINRYDGKKFDLRLIDDSTAYIGLSTFQINAVETHEIRDFIVANHSVPHLIVDLRNNGGGDMDVLAKLLSYVTDRPMNVPEGYRKVCRRGSFPSFRYSINYSADTDDIFGDEYVAEDGCDGFYARTDVQPIMPDSAAHYGDRLYVLVNENSCSAAALFAAHVLYSHRGLVIGRETRTAYHYMTALKFVDICLPNSRVTWHIPLVKCVFDTAENPRIPYGRGVIPDIYVPLTYGEVAFADGDAILNRALQAIADGEYLGGSTFGDESGDGGAVPAWVWWTAGTIALAALLVTSRCGKMC